MRFDTPVYFQRVLPGAYNADNGNYGEETVIEDKIFAAVSSPGIDTLKLIYGELKQGCLTIRLQRPYKKEFDRIRVGKKLYRVDIQKPLNNKSVFIVSEAP